MQGNAIHAIALRYQQKKLEHKGGQTELSP